MGKIDKLTPFDCILCTTTRATGCEDVYHSSSLGVEGSRRSCLVNTPDEENQKLLLLFYNKRESGIDVAIHLTFCLQVGYNYIK